MHRTGIWLAAVGPNSTWVLIVLAPQSNGSTQLGSVKDNLQVPHTCYSLHMQAGSVPSCSSAPMDCSLSSAISLLSLADLSSAACSSC